MFSASISNEPLVESDITEADKTSPSKKQPVDMKERKRLAKRIIKMVQPQLENAVRVEAELSGLSIETSRKELERLVEASYQSQHDYAAGLNPVGDVTVDEMTNTSQKNQNGVQSSYGNPSAKEDDENQKPNEADKIADIEMEDADAPYEEDIDAVVVDTSSLPKDAGVSGDSISSSALVEVNGNISPMKNNHINGIKPDNVAASMNGYSQAAEDDQQGPPTPPVSNEDISSDQGSRVLIEGGVPRFLLQNFNIKGTQISEAEVLVMNAVTDDLSPKGDDELNGLSSGVTAEGEVVTTTGRSTPLKIKKGKARRKRFGWSKAR